MQITAHNIDNLLYDIIGVNIEDFNEQVRTCARKIQQGDFDYHTLSDPSKGNVHTKNKHVKEKFKRYDKEFWYTWPTCFDPGCGDGEFLSVWKENLINAGCPDKEIHKRIFWADPEPANVMLTAQRLGMSIDNGFSFQVGKVDETYVNKRGELKTRKKDKLVETFEEGLACMKFDINKAHVIGNLPFTYGKGNSPVAIPVLTNILSLGRPASVNLVNDAGFLTSSNSKDFRELLKQHGLKYLGYNPQDLFEKGGATVHTVDLFCEKGYSGDIEVKSITGENFTVPNNTNYIVDGGNKILSEFLLSLESKTEKYGVLLNNDEKHPWKCSYGKLSNIDENMFSDTEKDNFLKCMTLFNRTEKKYTYIHKNLLEGSRFHNTWRVAFGYLPLGSISGHTLTIGITTVVPPGVYLPNTYIFFVCDSEEHAVNTQRYITSNVIDKFVLPNTRRNRTFDGKTSDGVTKFIPKLPEGVTIENDDDVFDFLETPEHIREAVRERF